MYTYYARVAKILDICTYVAKVKSLLYMYTRKIDTYNLKFIHANYRECIY